MLFQRQPRGSTGKKSGSDVQILPLRARTQWLPVLLWRRHDKPVLKVSVLCADSFFTYLISQRSRASRTLTERSFQPFSVRFQRSSASSTLTERSFQPFSVLLWINCAATRWTTEGRTFTTMPARVWRQYSSFRREALEPRAIQDSRERPWLLVSQSVCQSVSHAGRCSFVYQLLAIKWIYK